jgi:hypothetical protein
VEVHIDLADGTAAKLFEKPPVLTAEDDLLWPDSAYPIALALDCEMSRTADGLAYVTLLHGVSDPSGEATFLVREENVLPDD